MKKLTFILTFCLGVFSLKAQTNLVLNGDMTGTSLNYVNVSQNYATPAPGTGWAGYYGSARPLDIVSVKDGTNDIIKLTATAANTDITNNPRLVQRLTSLTPGNYRLTFKVKTINSNTTKIRPTIRSTGSSTPGYLLKDYTTGFPCFKDFTVSTEWTEYSVDFDLTTTSSSLHTYAGSTIISGITDDQTPVICFSLQNTTTEITNAGAAGIGIMIDDVSFTSLSTTPIELISFNGKVDKSGNLALLEWKTASNSMMKFIEIEKSIDGILFSKIASVDPRDDKTYTYTDENFSGQNAYYRLNQTDIDGTSSYSRVIYLKHDSADNLSVFPNPASDKIIVSHPNSTAYSTLKIIASTGQNVYQSKINALNSQTTIDIQNLSSGIYLVVLESGKDKQYLKFIK